LPPVAWKFRRPVEKLLSVRSESKVARKLQARVDSVTVTLAFVFPDGKPLKLIIAQDFGGETQCPT
jgi:hypothetical protein